MSQTIYIHGSKKDINDRLAEGEQIQGRVYSPQGSNVYLLVSMEEGTLVKFWRRKDAFGTPIACSYGLWQPDKKRVK